MRDSFAGLHWIPVQVVYTAGLSTLPCGIEAASPWLLLPRSVRHPCRTPAQSLDPARAPSNRRVATHDSCGVSGSRSQKYHEPRARTSPTQPDNHGATVGGRATPMSQCYPSNQATDRQTAQSKERAPLNDPLADNQAHPGRTSETRQNECTRSAPIPVTELSDRQFHSRTTPDGDKSCHTHRACEQKARLTSRLVRRDRPSARRRTHPCH